MLKNIRVFVYNFIYNVLWFSKLIQQILNNINILTLSIYYMRFIKDSNFILKKIYNYQKKQFQTHKLIITTHKPTNPKIPINNPKKKNSKTKPTKSTKKKN